MKDKNKKNFRESSLKYYDRTSVWYVKNEIDYGAGLLVGSKGYAFQFSSPAARVKAAVFFFGPSLTGGLTAAWNTGGSSNLPEAQEENYEDGQRIACQHPFSIKDLHNTNGSIIGLSAGAVLAYGAAKISADGLFDQQMLKGFKLGIGLSGSITIGEWRALKFILDHAASNSQNSG
ncbi:MAG: hypothetical protein GVY09_13205 [Gammaproteobacteria bacterium]|nr:hypothetical protein [Gammaproteobacteria bacterium]